MTKKRASKEQLQERYERAATLLADGHPSHNVVQRLAAGYDVSPQQAREYVREADHFCKFFECTHFTYTPPIPKNV